jgi:hypothetical protein
MSYRHFHCFSSKRVGIGPIKKPVFILLTHSPSCGRPARARPAPSANHNATRLGLKFNFVSEPGFL